MNPMDGVMLDPHGREIYLDDGDEPCLRLVEALGRIIDDRRVSGCGAFVQRWDGERWEYVAGPFWGSLSGFSAAAVDALLAARDKEIGYGRG